MAHWKVERAEFQQGGTSLERLPDAVYPEVAIVGRSNVGKSTLINRLTKRNKLARTSSMPGRTQELNYFLVELSAGKRNTCTLYLVDLPGFGYAKLSHAKREELSRLTVDYLSGRENLSVVLLLNDSRRLPERDELAVQKLAFDNGAHVIVVLTKVDKLKPNERVRQIRAVASAYGLQEGDVLLTGEELDPHPIWERCVTLLGPLDRSTSEQNS